MQTKLPDAFVARMRDQLGGEAEAFFQSIDQAPTTSIRLHHRKGRHAFSNTESIPWCDLGLYLSGRPAFQADPHWHAGAYYVQEASSMILDFVLRQLPMHRNGKIWVDLCAAPGGKTGILAAHMDPADVLLANEVIPQRRQVLAENLIKGGFPNVLLSGTNAEAFREPFADVMLIDAPCAGEGMMRKDPEAIRQWSPSLVTSCAVMQQRIVTSAAHALRPGGYLIYSTCSYSEAENILNAVSFSRQFGLLSIAIDFPETFGIATLEKSGVIGYQLYPHRVRGEGLFITVFRHAEPASPPRVDDKRHPLKLVRLPAGLADLTTNGPEFMTIPDDTHFPIVTAEAAPQLAAVRRHFPKAAWLPVAGEIKGKDAIPSHWLAMSPWISPDLTGIGLSLPHALDYLERKIPLTLPPVGRGWHPVTHEGSCLGWMKLTPQGWRNYYPTAWRLRQRPSAGG